MLREVEGGWAWPVELHLADGRRQLVEALAATGKEG